MTEASMKYVGRFAPSPTGPLHFGSLVAAVASYLDARARGGTWLVRIEDVDTTRCQASFAGEILQALSAFGLAWDGDVVYQSRRVAQYEAALAQLAARDLTYACTCSRREIADSGLSGIDGPVYPGTCRSRRLLLPGNAVRVRTTPGAICFVDRVQGKCCQHLERDIGDFVLKRRDGLFAYQLAVVVDDAEQGVSHVVRGADLLDSTIRQVYLQQLLGVPTPAYLHIPVVMNEAGQKLSKQTLAPAIRPAEACKLLCAAFHHLGQPLPVADRYDTTAALLDFAARNWDPAAIPRQRCR
ncbi:MAG: tRNA glutamyl-Q(34) synthetase GluQRS [Betaproteobacteria bacterium]